MSTEYSASPGIPSTASIVEVEPNGRTSGDDLFNLNPAPPPPALELEDEDQDKLMMTEYDEDNVIVIDLSEERNASAKNQPLPYELQPPMQMFVSRQGRKFTHVSINKWWLKIHVFLGVSVDDLEEPEDMLVNLNGNPPITEPQSTCQGKFKLGLPMTRVHAWL